MELIEKEVLESQLDIPKSDAFEQILDKYYQMVEKDEKIPLRELAQRIQKVFYPSEERDFDISFLWHFGNNCKIERC